MPSNHSVERDVGPMRRFAWWIQLRGNRLVLAAAGLVLVFLCTFALVRFGVITVGPKSNVPNAFTRLVGGLLTLVTVTLTINQLILSRVFGTPNDLSDQLDGNREFRDTVGELTNSPSTPIEPGEFVSVVGDSLHERATDLQSDVGDGDPASEGPGSLSVLVEQAEDLRDVRSETSTVEVLDLLIGSRTAENIATVDRLRNERGEDLSADERADLDAMAKLLDAVAITSQYYKTLALQQTLAQLSRYVTYLGAVAVVTSFYVATVYRVQAPPTLPPEYLPWVATLGFTVALAPLAVLLAYVLRVATVSRYTLSVGPFVPPKEEAH